MLRFPKIVMIKAKIEDKRASIVLEPILKYGQVHRLNLQDKVIFVVNVNASIQVVMVIIMFNPSLGSHQRT